MSKSISKSALQELLSQKVPEYLEEREITLYAAERAPERRYPKKARKPVENLRDQQWQKYLAELAANAQ